MISSAQMLNRWRSALIAAYQLRYPEFAFTDLVEREGGWSMVHDKGEFTPVPPYYYLHLLLELWAERQIKHNTLLTPDNPEDSQDDLFTLQANAGVWLTVGPRGQGSLRLATQGDTLEISAYPAGDEMAEPLFEKRLPWYQFTDPILLDIAGQEVNVGATLVNVLPMSLGERESGNIFSFPADSLFVVVATGDEDPRRITVVGTDSRQYHFIDPGNFRIVQNKTKEEAHDKLR